MATRGRTTFQKRQKEMARKEKQQMKAERRAQRKRENAMAEPTSLQISDPGHEIGVIGQAVNHFLVAPIEDQHFTADGWCAACHSEASAR